jgi:hypothetical protein
VKLLVEQIKVDRTEDGHTQVHITYRFGSPPEESETVYGVQHSLLWYNAILDLGALGGERSYKLYGLHPRNCKR